jgi:histone-lysine N-methyltransferase SETMAR
VDDLGKFLKVFKQKRPEMAAGDWWFHWGKVPVHTAAMVTDWMAAKQFPVIEHPSYLPDLAPADFFLFPKVKRELAGLTLTKETLKTKWEGAARTLKAADFATAFRHWYEHYKKCINIAGSYVEKS